MNKSTANKIAKKLIDLLKKEIDELGLKDPSHELAATMTVFTSLGTILVSAFCKVSENSIDDCLETYSQLVKMSIENLEGKESEPDPLH